MTPTAAATGPATIDLAVAGMSCAACVGRVERALGRVAGVQGAVVNLATERARVSVTPGQVTVADLAEAAGRAGYAATAVAAADSSAAAPAQGVALRRVAIAAALAAPLVLPMPLGWLGLTLGVAPWLQLLLATLVQFGPGAAFYRAAWRAARDGAGSMDTLVALGTTAAYGLSVALLVQGWSAGTPPHHLYFEASAAIVTLVLLGRWLEGRARRQTGAALAALAALAPATVRLRRVSGEVEVPAAALRLGDAMVVRPGERIAADGRVLEGSSGVDEQLLTGESRPVQKQPGDPVIGGSVNGEGALLVEATGVGADTALARIVRLVEAAQTAKPPIQRQVDQVAGWFVPVVLSLALATFGAWALAGAPFGTALLNAVAVLVIACPCALGLATPTAILAGTGAAARAGILLTDAMALETAARIDTVAFDKTGTLTEGRPVLTRLLPVAGYTEAALLQAAATLQAGSEHALARAVLAAVATRPTAPADLRARPGRGVEGSVGSTRLVLGNARLLTEHGLDPGGLAAAAAAEEALGRTVSFLAELDPAPRMLGLLSFGDGLRPGAATAVARLHAAGLRTVLLTGDGLGAGTVAAEAVGITDVRARLLPADKVAAIAELRAGGRAVAMVGDGVNDAPALAAADLGLAMASGTDVARHAAAITLLRPEPGLVLAALDIARRTRAAIRRGLFWAFVYNAVGLPLAAAGLLSPTLAGGAMAASSVCVVLSALWLGRWRPEPADVGLPSSAVTAAVVARPAVAVLA